MSEAFVVELTPSAAKDLRSIHAYISSHASRVIADQLLDELVERCSVLDRFPMRGSVPKELEESGHDEFRQLVLDRYRIFYQVAGKRVRIVLIADGRRDMQEILRRRLITPPDSPR